MPRNTGQTAEGEAGADGDQIGRQGWAQVRMCTSVIRPRRQGVRQRQVFACV